MTGNNKVENTAEIVKDLTAQEALAMLGGTTSFDEVLPEPITVGWIEYIEQEQMVGGIRMTKRKAIKRVSEIETYVPVKILNRMMASQEKIKKLQALRSQDPTQLDGQTQKDMVDWMSSQVLSVWQLTEPAMTLEKLQEGLDFKKTLGLFNLFFGNLLQGMNKQ